MNIENSNTMFSYSEMLTCLYLFCFCCDLFAANEVKCKNCPIICYFTHICCIKQPPEELLRIAEDSWKQVHRLFMFDDEWHLDKGVDDICVYSRHSSGLGKILKLEVSYIFILTVLMCPAHFRCI